MNFELTKEQKAIQKAAWEFADGEFDKEYALECELAHRYPTEKHKKAAELGFIGMNFPEEYGGQGYGILESVLVLEQFMRKDSGVGHAVTICQFDSQFILRWGTEEQKKKWLPLVASGKVITGAAFTEPDHGSDITDVDTTAVREGDEYVINGVKTFITNGLQASVIAVLCKTDPNASPTHRGMSMILVETDRPGFEATDIGQKMGIRMTSTTEIALKNVRVPITNLIGAENRGFYLAL